MHKVWQLRVPGGGTFEHIRGQHWAQFYQGHMIPFLEVTHLGDAVELIDQARNIKVRLTPGMCYQEVDGAWRESSEGDWQ